MNELSSNSCNNDIDAVVGELFGFEMLSFDKKQQQEPSFAKTPPLTVTYLKHTTSKIRDSMTQHLQQQQQQQPKINLRKKQLTTTQQCESSTLTDPAAQSNTKSSTIDQTKPVDDRLPTKHLATFQVQVNENKTTKTLRKEKATKECLSPTSLSILPQTSLHSDEDENENEKQHFRNNIISSQHQLQKRISLINSSRTTTKAPTTKTIDITTFPIHKILAKTKTSTIMTTSNELRNNKQTDSKVKISTHGKLGKLFGKKAIRAKELLIQNLFTSAPKSSLESKTLAKNELFGVYERNFVRQQDHTEKLTKAFKNYATSLKNTQHASKNLISCIQNSTRDYQSARHDLVCENLNQADSLSDELLSKLTKDIVTNIGGHLGDYSAIRDKIAKRKRKLVDYDSSRRNYESLLANVTRRRLIAAQEVEAATTSALTNQATNSSQQHLGNHLANYVTASLSASSSSRLSASAQLGEEEKLLKLRETNNYNKLMFETINAQLMQELPATYEKRMRNLLVTLQAYFALQASYHVKSGKLFSSSSDIIDECPLLHFKQVSKNINNNSNKQTGSKQINKSINKKRTSSNTDLSVASSYEDEIDSENDHDNDIDNDNEHENSQLQNRIHNKGYNDFNSDSASNNSSSNEGVNDDNNSVVEAKIVATNKEITKQTNKHNIDTISASTSTDSLQCASMSTSNVGTNNEHSTTKQEDTDKASSLSSSGASSGATSPDANPIEINNNNTLRSNVTNDDSIKQSSEVESTPQSKYPKNTQIDVEVTQKKATDEVAADKKSNDVETNKRNNLNCLYKVQANYLYMAEDVDELSFDVNDVIQIVEYDGVCEPEDGWLMGVKENGEKGLVPANYTTPI